MFVRSAPSPVFLSVGLAAACICMIAAAANGASPLPQQEGLASVYGKQFNGRSTASGERYDSRALTAAHRTLPLRTNIRVTNLENGKSVRVRINDRGPHVRGRIVDLSSSAAAALGFSTGVARVRIGILSYPARAGRNVPDAFRKNRTE
jgi:rare lipoprotein A